MRPRSLLVLSAVVLVLGAFIWFYERELPGSEEREAQAKRVLPRLTAEEVTAVELEQGEERVRIERVDAPGEGGGTDGDAPELGGTSAAAGWRIVSPQSLAGAPADGVAVEGLLSALAALEKSRTLEDFTASALGLEPPQARVALELEDGGTITLAVGADLPASSDMVVLTEGTGEAHVVDRTIRQDLSRAPGEWRSRQMFTAARDRVARIRLESGTGDDGEVVLERAAGGFRLVRPFDDAAEAAAVDRLLGALTGLTADRFIDAPVVSPGELGLEPPRGTVSADLEGGGAPVVVEIGAPRPEGSGHTYRLGKQIFIAGSTLAEAAARPAAEWRSTALTDLELYRIDEVRVDGAAGSLVLRRDGTDWLRDGESISYTPVSDLLFALVEATADEVVAGAGTPAGTPELTVELVAAARQEGGEPERRTIGFHPRRDDRVPVTVSGRGVVLGLAPETYESILAELERVRAAEVVTGAAADELLPDDVEIEREVGY